MNWYVQEVHAGKIECYELVRSGGACW